MKERQPCHHPDVPRGVLCPHCLSLTPIISKMPDRETLEAFLKGFHGTPTVIFDSEKGEFISVNKPVNTDPGSERNVPR